MPKVKIEVKEPVEPIPDPPKISPKNCYAVTRFSPTNLGVVEEMVVEAHKVIIEGAAAIFVDVVSAPYGVQVETHRILFEVLDIRLLREFQHLRATIQ